MHLYKNYRAELRSKGHTANLVTASSGYYSVWERQGRAFIHIGCVEIFGRVTLAKITDAVRRELVQ